MVPSREISMIITNTSDIPLSLAVWCVHDEYDYVNTPNYISATRLMKPLRQLVLSPRVPEEDQTADVSDYISSALGHSLHDSIEKAWVKGYERNLKKLGYPDSAIKRVKINPSTDELEPDTIPIYLEQRATKKIVVRGVEYTIGGKFDMVAEGIVHDNKSTTAYTWLYGGKDDDYQLQGSIYRWLNPDKITEDFIRICFIFTDWQRVQAASNPNYPQKRLEYKDIPLLSLEDTEQWIINKITQIIKYQNADQSVIPECTDDELWRSAPKYKYYRDPAKTTGRSTKNFDDPVEAKKHILEQGGKGVIITIPGEVKRCGYCDAASICEQRKRLFND